MAYAIRSHLIVGHFKHHRHYAMTALQARARRTAPAAREARFRLGAGAGHLN